MVIKALGFDPEDLPTLFDSNELQVTNGELSKQILIQWRQI